jgi:phosphoribosylformimino-5-aminoimidazole carboxamide ribotide isomerase
LLRVAETIVRIIPVLDLLNGVVVRAVGGRRNEYQPVVSRITDSTQPLAVAHELLEATQATELYIADLDAIIQVKQPPQPAACLPELLRLQANLWIDAGLRHDTDAIELRKAGIEHFVVGTETLSGPGALGRMLETHGASRVTLSIDSRAGELIGNWLVWGANPSEAYRAILQHADAIGIRKLLLLDLAAVGSLAGPSAGERLRVVRQEYPHFELLVGGGVRNRDDMKRLEDAGADGVLVASALHNGMLP